MKKLFVSFVALLVSTVAFALPTPPDDTDPMAQALKQYTEQMEEVNKKFDQLLLPPLQGLLQIVKEVSMQDTLTAQQEQKINEYQDQFTQVLTDLVAPIVADIDMNEVNAQAKQLMTATGQPVQEISKEDFTNLMMGMTLISALNHFAQANLITQEDLEILGILLFGSEENVQ